MSGIDFKSRGRCLKRNGNLFLQQLHVINQNEKKDCSFTNHGLHKNGDYQIYRG